MAEPIMEFKSEQEAYECLREWQDRLFLNNWIIKLHFCDSIDNENGEELAGKNTFQITNQCCTIRIVKLNDDSKSRIAKVSQEAVLVHELLHCKYNWLQPPNSIEGNYYDELEHALLEQMAKSLIMAKYNISFSWFKNFRESEGNFNLPIKESTKINLGNGIEVIANGNLLKFVEGINCYFLENVKYVDIKKCVEKDGKCPCVDEATDKILTETVTYPAEQIELVGLNA